MSAERRAAAWIGALFIVGTGAMILGFIVTADLVTGTATLDQVAAERGRVAVGALLMLLAGFALAAIPVVFWPIGRRYDERLAMGYVVFRGAIETVLYVVCVLGWLLLVALAREPGAAPLAGFLRAVETVIWDQLIAIPFVVGALMFYLLLHRSRLVPRWLSTWGLVGAVLYAVAPIGSMFGLSLGAAMAPLALQEMVLAVWLIARGFDTPAAVPELPGATSTWSAGAASAVSTG